MEFDASKIFLEQAGFQIIEHYYRPAEFSSKTEAGMERNTPVDNVSTVESWQEGVQTLLSQSRVCFLATQGKSGPETSMAPYAVHQGNILLHLSQLARHTVNIETSSAIGLMICTSETTSVSPLALPRLSLQGEAVPVFIDQLAAAKAAYLQNIPDAEPLFSFGDFRLFQFTPAFIYWVGGFGKARKISPQQWHKLTHYKTTQNP